MQNKRSKHSYILLETIRQASHLTWFYYTVADAIYAPDIRGQSIFASICGSYAKSISHTDSVSDKELRLSNAIVLSCESFHQTTRASDWVEALIKAALGDIITSALYSVLLGKDEKKFHVPNYIIDQLESYVTENPLIRSRVELYCRRILSESITLGQNIFALYADSVEKDNRVKNFIEKVSVERNSEEIIFDETIISGDDTKKNIVIEPILNTIVNLTSRITELYEQRMNVLGLHETVRP